MIKEGKKARDIQPGQWVLFDSKLRDGIVSDFPRKVVSTTKGRVYYDREGEKTWKSTMSIAYVADTEEELLRIVDVSKRQFIKIADVRQGSRVLIAKIMEEANAQTA